MSASRLLLVDPDTESLARCQRQLEAAGLLVTGVPTGAKALELLAAAPDAWDLMLLDMHAAGMDGLAVMHELQQREVGIGVIVLGRETAFHWVSSALQSESFNTLCKPFSDALLLETIHKAERKRALEKSIVGLRKQLERSERLHRFMIESSPDIIFIVDKEGRFRFINDRAEDLLGYRKDELLGEHYSVIVDPGSMARAAACFSERRSSLRAARDEEIWLRCKLNTRLTERRRIAIELNAMGVYEHESTSGRNDRQQKDYSGTYVVARDITERLNSQKLIQYQAYHDLLTGLPNRALFMDRLTNAISQARRNKTRLAVMFLDLDRFKFVNDTLGHDVGDALLKKVAERLRGCLRESDTLARLGGDEFIVLLPMVESAATARTVADKIVRAIRHPLGIGNHELCVTTSVGIAMYPENGEAADVLIKNADIAMYHTKDLGKDGFNIFTQELSEQQKLQMSLEGEIRRGLRENQFTLYYQPQVNADDGAISGVEAFLRWNHPERGLLTPSFFLPVAEESSLIVELGDWAMHRALEDVQKWRRDGLDVQKLALNFSYRQIEQADFVDKIIHSLKLHDFPGEAFEIEITEGALMGDAERTVGKLRQLHSYGVQIAIDDFGTGYSSLSMLQKLPITRLKIDRSFIQDLRTDSDRSIIEAIAHMARGLRLDMVAEGVELDYQLRYLRKLDCHVVQGFLYSQCVPADDVKRLLAQNRVQQVSSLRG